MDNVINYSNKIQKELTLSDNVICKKSRFFIEAICYKFKKDLLLESYNKLTKDRPITYNEIYEFMRKIKKPCNKILIMSPLHLKELKIQNKENLYDNRKKQY